jgi:hypothetical protein
MAWASKTTKTRGTFHPHCRYAGKQGRALGGKAQLPLPSLDPGADEATGNDADEGNAEPRQQAAPGICARQRFLNLLTQIA